MSGRITCSMVAAFAFAACTYAGDGAEVKNAGLKRLLKSCDVELSRNAIDGSNVKVVSNPEGVRAGAVALNISHTYQGDLKFAVLFNPKEYTITKSTPWKHHDIQGLDSPTLEFTSGEGAFVVSQISSGVLGKDLANAIHNEPCDVIALCIEGYHWDDKKCGCVSDGPAGYALNAHMVLSNK